jgi:NAD(P)-dependent dehydrogenase (short-subunit alcohol dehydrogenase family)
MPQWTQNDIPDQTGRTVLVTGANSGLGLRTAQVLAANGARVLMACRSPERGAVALRSVTEVADGGSAELVPLDLADLSSVHEAAERVRDLTGDGLDVLVNNAGVMWTSKRHTKDGFELQFGTNHLGHAALTWLLLPALRGRPASRVVTVSSLTARAGRINLADSQFEHHRYTALAAYGQAKLANLMFALELDRRLRDARLDVLSVATHPGYTATELTRNSARSRTGALASAYEFITGVGDRLVGQDVRFGALPQLFAATAPSVRGGEYYAPDGWQELRGFPRRVTPPRQARSVDVAAGLWDLTVRLTGVSPVLT